MPQDVKPQLGKEVFGDFAWKCETTSSTYDNRTTFARGARDSLGDCRRPLTQRGTSTKPPASSVIVLPSLSQSRVPVSLDGFDVDDYVKTG